MVAIVTPMGCAIVVILLMKKLRLGQAGRQWCLLLSWPQPGGPREIWTGCPPAPAPVVREVFRNRVSYVLWPSSGSLNISQLDGTIQRVQSQKLHSAFTVEADTGLISE